MRYIVGSTAVLLSLLFAAGGVEAQVIWDSPFLVPPAVESGFGLYITQPGAGKVGGMASWRPLSGSSPLGLRVGLGENKQKKFTGYGGVDLTGSVLRVGKESPVDLDWVAGAGLALGRPGVVVSVPVGFTVGRSLRYEGNRFTPYLIPRVNLDIALGDRHQADALRHRVRLKVAMDIGIDAQWRDRWLARFGYTINGVRDAVAVGVVFLR